MSEVFETYDKVNDVMVDGEPYLILNFNIENVNKQKYIGLTKELTAKKASMIHYKINGEEYALRRYIIKSFKDYIRKKYPSTYMELTKITPDMLDDSSDVINFTSAFSGAINVEHFPYLDTSNGENFSWMYRSNAYTTEFPDINTSKGKDFSWMYCDCFRAIKVSDIDLSSILSEDITINKKLDSMLSNCNSLTSVTFNNVPKGITIEQMRIATSAPLTCEIILYHRSQ